VATTARRFPPPWSVEDISAAFVVKDSAGQKPGYFYYEEEPGLAAKPHTKDELKLMSDFHARNDRVQAHVSVNILFK